MHSSPQWQCLTQHPPSLSPLSSHSLPALWGHWRQSYCHVSGTFGLAIWPFACCSLLLICFNELSCDFIERIGQKGARDCYKKKTAEGGGGERRAEEKGKTLRKAATVAICLLTCIITSAIALAHAAAPHLATSSCHPATHL